MTAWTPRLRLSPTSVATWAGALSVLGAATSLAGVFSDWRWLLPTVVAVGVVAGIGAWSRKLRVKPALGVLAQLGALLVVLNTAFTEHGWLGAVPGPASIDELLSLLDQAVELVRTGVPPAPADPPLQCLATLGLGLVAVLVDLIVVVFGSPAVAGLVLLCVLAVPASLSGDMLPWWSFAAGGLTFTLLLACRGQHRKEQQEHQLQRTETLFGRTAAVVAGTATVLALLAGVVFTGVGTEGRLPGESPARFRAGSGIGLKPFTSLRGQLNREQQVELFRVRGLSEPTYLRAITLRKFNPERGWELDGLTQGVDASLELPLPEGTTINNGRHYRVEIEPTGYRDPWLPIFGVPSSVSGMGPNWRYDPAAGIVFTQTTQESRPYVEQFTLPTPTATDLRTAHGPLAIAPAYLDTTGVPPQITELAQRLTSQAPTDFDKAVAINRFFTEPENGFVYDVQTAPAAGTDALTHFLFQGKRGFCEQYASAMAVLLRAVGIPSRVAVGFTPGYQDGEERVITTDDAHAWVEAYFPGWGWQIFDPTPLQDGRGSVPQFLEQELNPAPPEESSAPSQSETDPRSPEAQPEQPADQEQQDARRPVVEEDGGGWLTATAGVVLLAALLGLPALLRELRRRQRLQAINAGSPRAASIAWREVLDEFRDRGTEPAASATARALARDLVDRHQLDEQAAAALDELVRAVEREWYAPSPANNSAGGVLEALNTVVGFLRRTDPLPWRARLFPPSLLAAVAPRRVEKATGAR